MELISQLKNKGLSSLVCLVRIKAPVRMMIQMLTQMLTWVVGQLHGKANFVGSLVTLMNRLVRNQGSFLVSKRDHQTALTVTMGFTMPSWMRKKKPILITRCDKCFGIKLACFINVLARKLNIFQIINAVC